MITPSAIAKEITIQDRVITKVYGPYEDQLGRELIELTHRYRDELMKSRVEIPNNFETKFTDGFIFIQDEYVGEDLRIKMENGLEIIEKRVAVGHLVDFLNELPSGSREGTTRVMGDFKPANFVDKNSQLIFVDHFLPRIWGEDGLVRPYLPEDQQYFNRQALTYLWGFREGQVGRLLGLLDRQHPEVSQYAINYATEQSPNEISEFINREASVNFPTITQAYATRV